MFSHFSCLFPLVTLSSPPFPPGDRYWVFSESKMEKDSPKSLRELGTGLPKDKIDAVLFYTITGHTYFFRGNK